MGKLVVFLMLFIAFISCDGKYRAHMGNTEILKESKLLESFSEQLSFFPEGQVKITTDTVLSTGFRIKISYSSIENNYVQKNIKIKDSIVIKQHFKNFKAEYSVLKDNTLIKTAQINKTLFSGRANSHFYT
ncbi:MAG: hypothetical protein ACK5NB_13235 [Flavobacteriaceae bacterium]